MHEADAALTMRTYWAWETTATLHMLGGALGAGAPTGGGDGQGISCATHTASYFSVVRAR